MNDDPIERAWNDDPTRHNRSLMLPKKHWRLPVFAGAAALVAVGMTAYAWNLRGDRNDAEDRAAAIASENQSLSNALELHRASAVDLDSQLVSCKDVLDGEQRSGAEQGAALASCRDRVSNLKEERSDAKQRLAEFNALSKELRRMIDSGKLDIRFRKGRMVVKLPAAVLFASGSADLSADGRATLKDVAKALRKMRRRFIIAGHTDAVPVGSDSAFHSNWALSTARAVTVTEALIKSGVSPKHLTAAGLGSHDPLSSNNTTQGRARNRRIEIILEPDMSAAATLDKRIADKRKSPKR